MGNPQSEEVQLLRNQISELHRRLGALHDGDVNSLMRAHRTLAQHIETLVVETQAVSVAASQLDGNQAWTMQNAMTQVVQTSGILWLGHLLGYWARANVPSQTGRRISSSMILLGAVAAATQLLVKGGRRLRNLLIHNPRCVDQLHASVAVLQQRVDIMAALSSLPIPSKPPLPSAPPVELSFREGETPAAMPPPMASPQERVGEAVESGNDASAQGANVAIAAVEEGGRQGGAVQVEGGAREVGEHVVETGGVDGVGDAVWVEGEEARRFPAHGDPRQHLDDALFAFCDEVS